MTSTPSPIADLADAVAACVLDADPLAGSELGIRRYDALLPDPSAAAEEALDADLARFADGAAGLTPNTPGERVTLAAVLATCARTRSLIAGRSGEFTVTAMPIAGPPALFATMARAVLPDPQSAEDYLSRLAAAPAWIDEGAQRLREGRSKGRLPVQSLVDQAIGWADRTLSSPMPDAFTSVSPPEGWDATEAWMTERDRIATHEVLPAVARWRELLVELRPSSRPDGRAGLGALPDGDEAYGRAISYHTTMNLSADELHAVGLDAVERLEAQARDLGHQIGLTGLGEIIAAVRSSAQDLDPGRAIEAARTAVARAEARAAEIMPLPLPGPCAVTPMPQTVAESGMAPHYTRPRPDGSRPGTYWFNTMRASAGAGWDLEAVAFHETVPGHHSQLARALSQPDLPLLQQLSVTVHAEGWGLYAERLAGEFGLYSGVQAQIGSVYIEMHRAARLVVDTGLHAFGWSRDRAVAYMLAHVALPETFLRDEIDRYIAWPGQALAYLVGLREILRLRTLAQAATGGDFDLPSFNGALLDSGSVPMPVLATLVDDWISART